MKTLLLALAVLGFGFNAVADDASSGCGLGWAVTKRQSLLASSTRSYTNATFFNTIGMTLGTSGCAKHSIVLKEKEAEHFAEANYHNLMMDIAMGEGKYADNFASVMGCRNTPDFSKALQSDFGKLFNNTSPAKIVSETQDVIMNNPALVRACSAII